MSRVAIIANQQTGSNRRGADPGGEAGGALSEGLAIERSGALVACRVEVAGTWRARLVGLLGRTGLDDGAGLLLVPCSGVHTFFMRFAIDVVLLDRQGLVLRTIPRLRPWRATRIVPQARSTLELPAGTIERSGLREGDRLVAPVSRTPAARAAAAPR